MIRFRGHFFRNFSMSRFWLTCCRLNWGLVANLPCAARMSDLNLSFKARILIGSSTSFSKNLLSFVLGDETWGDFRLDELDTRILLWLMLTFNSFYCGLKPYWLLLLSSSIEWKRIGSVFKVRERVLRVVGVWTIFIWKGWGSSHEMRKLTGETMLCSLLCECENLLFTLSKS